jgi:hypothetical protein
MAPEGLRLPLSVTGPADLSRLLRELDGINEQLLQLQLRRGGTEVKLSKTSRLMDQAVELNGLNLLHDEDRLTLRQAFQAVLQRAPVLHFSFSADPSPEFMTKLLAWLRREIHPLVLVTTGLRPTIGAGCIVRTTNRSFDLSLSQSLKRQRQLLTDKLLPPPAESGGEATA